MPTYSVRINGRTRQVEGEPDDNLLSVLRYDLDLTGIEVRLRRRDCGACTVLVDNQAARSCVDAPQRGRPARPSRRSKGLRRATLHPVQQAFLDAEAFQCGYCTPGMVMATVGLLREQSRADGRRTSPASWTATSAAAAPTRASSAP